MEKTVRIAYAMAAVALAALLIYYFVKYRVDAEMTLPKMGFQQVAVDGDMLTGATEVSGDLWRCKVPINGVTQKYCHLIFYTIHENVEVYFNDELIYSMAPSPKKQKQPS